MKAEGQISLLELMFSGNIATSIFLGLIILLGIIFLYLFFLKYFYLKSLNKDEEFFDNIADCLYDHRIDSALDMCKRVISPESRIIKKGLDKVGGSPFERFIAVVNQREIEMLSIKKNLFRFGLLARIIVLLGVLGTGVSFFSFFVLGEGDYHSVGFYNSFLPMCAGAFLGMLVYIQQIILISLVSRVEEDLKIKGNKFLEIVEETK